MFKVSNVESPHNDTETVEEEKVKFSFIKTLKHRLDYVLEDEEAVEGLKACGRLFANLGISALDFIPGAGAASLAADIGKLSKKLDLTPAVNKSVAWGSEALEIPSGGTVPTHFIETTIQAVKDYKSGKLEKGWKAITYIFTGKEDYEAELAENKDSLDDAAEKFS